MSERLRTKPEFNKVPEQGSRYEQSFDKKAESHIEASKHEHKENINNILTKIENTAQTGQELSKQQKITPRTEQKASKYVSGELKNNTLKRSLRGLQKELRPYQRPFSKFIHNEAIDQISDLGAKTIARPEGLLGGGLAIFLTSLAILLICRYYGYQYNYLIGIASFPIGYLIALAAKLIAKPLSRN